MISFDDWIQLVFDHPVCEPAWYWDLYCKEPVASKSLPHLTRLFQDPEPCLAPYSDAQLNQGFWYLLSGSDSMCTLIEPSLPWAERQTCIRSLPMLFEQGFARRCSNHLSHLDEPGVNALNGACYMWWDLFPTWGRPEEPAFSETDTELLAVMSQILMIDSVPCQESALHGLGHWHLHYPAHAQAIIFEFLKSRSDLRPEVRRYALRAAQGCIQ